MSDNVLAERARRVLQEVPSAVKPAPFALDSPTSVAEILDLLSAHGDDAKVLAGGQSLVPMLNFRLVRPARLIDINGVADLSYINASNGHLAIGALTRQREIEESPAVAADAPLLSTATGYIAHPAIRNRGTIGGSLVHNDPAAEYPLALLCLGAEVKAASTRGERTILLADLLLPWLSTTLEPDELLVEIRVPGARARQGFGFREVARRPGDFAIAATAASVTLDASGKVEQATLAASAGRCAGRLSAAEQMLVGQSPSDELLSEVAAAAEREAEPVADIHADEDYRRHLLGVLARRALAGAIDNAGKD
jgi:carbon-monoxide dehydrogenase medium subunit